MKDETKKQAITKAVIRLINEVGFANISMSKIAKATGISAATLYVYYENKEDMFRKIYMDVKRAMIQTCSREICPCQSVEQSIKKLCGNLLCYMQQHTDEFLFIEQSCNSPLKTEEMMEEIERYSIIRTVSAVERCNVAVLVIDATEGITDQDTKIAGIAHERGKGMIIAVNKWDAIEKDDKTMNKFTKDVREKLAFMPYAEMLFISAETGQRLPKLFDTIDAVIENHAMRIGTGVLNEILSEAVAMKQPPSDKGRRLRLYYITQVSVKPPTFVIFINDKELTHFSYTRYIENQIRETFGFRGTPLHFIYRERKDKG